LKVLDFFKKYPAAGAGERSRRQAVENIEANIEWVSQHRDSIASWLHNNVHISH